MIEQYVIDELKSLKEENRKLKEELTKEQSKMVVSVEDKKIYDIELIETSSVIKKLEENGIDLIKMYDEIGSEEYIELIKKLSLFRDKFKKNKDIIAVVRVNSNYYEMTKYYGDYKLENQVYVDLDSAIRNQLVDRLYDILGTYKRDKEAQKKAVESNE